MKLKFINHSSFIIEYKKIKLICDPWLEGTAFNNGWKLISKTQMDYKEFNDITHIWFSHEHPDHFSPSNLLKIPKSIRAKIIVLYQETTDKKVANFCKNNGFKKGIELKEDEQLDLEKDFSIMCNPYTDGDSYALITVNDIKILNLNDCIVNTEERAFQLFKKIGKVDFLFTQFGYANKIGNTNDIELRKNASRERITRISYQNKFLKPKAIIPFASFIYFCHEENKYMNKGINTIDFIYSFIQNELNTSCIVLYPNDEFKIGENWDSSMAIKKYMTDYKKIPSKDYLLTNSIKESELIFNCKSFISKIKKGYPKKIKFINSLSLELFITDYDEAYTVLGSKGIFKSNKNYESCDIALSSDSLNYCFKELWGGDTLSINARYQIINDDSKFRVFSSIASNLNREEKFPIPTLSEKVINKVHSLYHNLLKKIKE